MLILVEFILEKQEPSTNGLRVVNNQMTLSRLLNNGRLKEGQPFQIEYWTAGNGKSQKKGELKVGGKTRVIKLRSWDLDICGVISGKMHSYFGVEQPGSYTTPAILITSNGAIIHLQGQRNRTYTEISPPIL